MAIDASPIAQSVATLPNEDQGPTGLAALVIVARQHGLHLTVAQLIHDNVLSAGEVTTAQIVKCASNSGMKAKVVHLGWDGLSQLNRALPVIISLKDGNSMVLWKARVVKTGDYAVRVRSSTGTTQAKLLSITR